MTTNMFPCLVTKMIQMDNMYRKIDKSDQEIGLKMLVSLCKRYERVLGAKYTLQTLVWYNLAGIESFFEEACSDYNSVICRDASECDTDTVHGDTDINSKECGDAEEEVTAAEYAVKAAEESDDQENENGSIVLQVYKVDNFSSNDKTDQVRDENADKCVQFDADINSENETTDGSTFSKEEQHNSGFHGKLQHWQSSVNEKIRQESVSDKTRTSVIVKVDKEKSTQKCDISESESEQSLQMSDDDIGEHILVIDLPNSPTMPKRQGNDIFQEKKSKQSCTQKQGKPLEVKSTCHPDHLKSAPLLDTQNVIMNSCGNRPNKVSTGFCKQEHEFTGKADIKDTDMTHEQTDGNTVGEDENRLDAITDLDKTVNVKKKRKEKNVGRMATKARLMEALEMNPIKKPGLLRRKGRPKGRQKLLKLHLLSKGLAKKRLAKETFIKTNCNSNTDSSDDVRHDWLGYGRTSEQGLGMDNVLKNSNKTANSQAIQKNVTEDTNESYWIEKKHQDRQEQEDKFSCQFCGRAFSRRRILFRHYRTHTEGRFACLRCGAIHKQADELGGHMDQHMSNGTGFDGWQQFDTNRKGPKANTYRQRQTSLPTREQLWKHQRKVHRVKKTPRALRSSSDSFVCSVCGKMYKRQCDLESHSRVHTGELPFECSVCKVFFRTGTALNKHKKTNKHCLRSEGHEIERQYLCQDCGKSYFKKHALQRHMRFHLGEKQHSCSYCDYRCQEANNLKRHMSLHFESERNFVCEICGAAFHAKKTLETHHVYKHSTERKFNCSQCMYTFKSKSALRRHEKVHSLDKEHQCICGMGFRRICNLRRHLRLVHGNDEILPPVKHVATLDSLKKLPLSKTDHVEPIKHVQENDTLYSSENNTSLIVSEPTKVDSEISVGTDDRFDDPSLKTGIPETPNQFYTSSINNPTSGTSSVSSYIHDEIEGNTSSPVVPQHQEVSDTVVSHEVPQPFLNREMFLGNLCFPHLAMGTNPIPDQHTPILPHIHMLQNPEYKDHFPTSLNKPTSKLTFTIGNYWQKLVHNKTESSYRDMEHMIRFPNNLVDNSVLISQRLNQDQRGAVTDDFYARLTQEELTQRLIHDSQRPEHHIVMEKSESDTNCVYPYRVTYNQSTGNQESVNKPSTSEQSEDSAYLQSRREMAAESLAQMAALAMDANFQQQNTDEKSQLL